jgi:hypothetical protein
MRSLFPNAYPVEVFQAASSIVALVILIWAAYDVVKDAMGVPQKDRLGARWTLAIGNVHRAFFRLMKAIVLAGVGISALFLPPPPPIFQAFIDSPEMRLSAFVVRMGIIVVTALMLVDAFVERAFRQRYVRTLRMNGEDTAPRVPDDRRQVVP